MWGRRHEGTPVETGGHKEERVRGTQMEKPKKEVLEVGTHEEPVQEGKEGNMDSS